MSTRKTRCPYCSKRCALTKTGKLYTHTDPATKTRCVRSGGRPN